MLRAPVLPLLGLLLACGGEPGPVPEAVSLPRVTTLGMAAADLRPAAAVVTLTRAGALLLDGAPVEVRPGAVLDQLRDRLRAAVERARAAEPAARDRSGGLPLVLRCDEAVPWRSVQWVLAAAADPRIRVWRTLFAVRPPAGEEEGTFAIFLPRERGLAATGRERATAALAVVALAPAGAAAPPAALHAYFRDRPGIRGVLLVAEAEVSVGAVLAAADALHRAGVERLSFPDAALPRGEEVFPPAPAAPVPASYQAGGHEDHEPILLPPGVPPELPPLPRSPGLAGFTIPPDVLPDDGD